MCPVCAGKGVIAAAGIEVIAVWTGSNPAPEHTARADWDTAVQVPCFACYPKNINVFA